MSTTRPQGSLYTKVRNGVAVMTFAHPNNNALGIELLSRLQQEFQNCAADDAVKVILLLSEDDGAFCTGIALDELTGIDPKASQTLYTSLAELYVAMCTSKKIVIGRVQGKTKGEGLGLLAACDYVFATDAASLQLPELHWSMLPILGAPLLLDKIGKTGFHALALTPTRWKNAYWAQDRGLYTKVFERISEMDKELDFFTTKLATYREDALYAIKGVGSDAMENMRPHFEKRVEMLKKQLLTNSVQETLSKIKKP
ncbi:enoyl-CoA hydratase/isomerase family protein [Spongiimicrobium salis]|uniref:enoyl-CoA hydratase/isomerase family protein n=1 Tax=Spongiimicrobium salis TaxID=1667022 RepID=UPI00374DA65B